MYIQGHREKGFEGFGRTPFQTLAKPYFYN